MVQGDRVGVCVTQLDAKALERGIACTHGHVTLISAALVSVRQIRFFKVPCKTGAKVRCDGCRRPLRCRRPRRSTAKQPARRMAAITTACPLPPRSPSQQTASHPQLTASPG